MMRTLLNPRNLSVLWLIGLGVLHMPAIAGGDARQGEDVFAQECAECHSAKEGRNKKGPTLFGVVGRKAGAVAEVIYSDALKQSGRTWNVADLDAYIANPRKIIPGSKMKYEGLADGKEREDLLAYLLTLK